MAASDIEKFVLNAWKALAYQGFGICPGCGKPAFCCGVNPESRICVSCFEFEFDCTPPNFRRRRG